MSTHRHVSKELAVPTFTELATVLFTVRGVACASRHRDARCLLRAAGAIVYSNADWVCVDFVHTLSQLTLPTNTRCLRRGGLGPTDHVDKQLRGSRVAQRR